MRTLLFHDHADQSCHIINFADRRDRVSSMMRTHDQRLRFHVGDTADAQVPLHFMDIAVKFGAERRIFNVVDGPIEPLFSINRHAASSGSQMRMIVRTEKQIEHAIFFRYNAKITAHSDVFPRLSSTKTT